MAAHPALATMLRGQQAVALHSNPERYLARCDEWMFAMSDAERLVFLRAELAKWEARYRNFQSKVFAGQNLEGDVSAWDYAEVIAVLATRIASLERLSVAA